MGGDTNKGIVTDYMGVPVPLGTFTKGDPHFIREDPHYMGRGKFLGEGVLNSLAISISWRGLFSEVCFLVGFIFPDDFPSVGRSVSGSLGEGLRFLEIFHGGYSQAGGDHFFGRSLFPGDLVLWGLNSCLEVYAPRSFPFS